MDQQERKRRNIDNSVNYAEFFNSERGRKVLADLSQQFYFNPFISVIHNDGNGKVDPYKTIYNQGMRDVIQHIYSMIWIAQHADEYTRDDVAVKQESIDDILDQFRIKSN